MTRKVTITEGLDCFVADASRNDGLGKIWIASALALLAMTRKVVMTEELDSFVAGASRNEGLMKKHLLSISYAASKK